MIDSTLQIPDDDGDIDEYEYNDDDNDGDEYNDEDDDVMIMMVTLLSVILMMMMTLFKYPSLTKCLSSFSFVSSACSFENLLSRTLCTFSFRPSYLRINAAFLLSVAP